MEGSGNTVLVTGGGSGIGLALASRYLADNNTVIVCGRRKDVLGAAAAAHPGLVVRTCDLSREREREELVRSVTDEFPSLNVLVNNAGVQVRSGLSADRVWNDFRNEIAINLEAPIHMSLLLLDQFRRAGDSAIINVSSGLAFAPMALAPVYCATKAALHSFTLSLRYEVSGSGVRVVELIPPAVNTDLGGTGLHTRGAPLEEFADVVYSKLKRGDLEIGHGFSDQARLASRQQLDEMFDRMNPPR